MDLLKGQKYELDVISLNHDGEGVGRLEGLAVFVPGALPGERVLARVKELRRSFARAVLLEVRQSSPERVPPSCASFGACGGCHLQHLDYTAQLTWKTKMLAETLRRVGGLNDPPVQPALGLRTPWRYRNRVDLHLLGEAGRIRLGFYRTGTHAVVPLADCLLIPEDFQNITAWLEENLPRKAVGSLEGILLRKAWATGRLLVGLRIKGEALPGGSALAGKLREAHPIIASVVELPVGLHGKPDKTQARVLAGMENLEDRLGPFTFTLSPEAFFQVNSPQAEILYDLAAAAAGCGESLLELYCGAGVLTLFLAKRYQKVLGVEISGSSLEDARSNSDLNGVVNTSFLAGRVEKILPRLVRKGYQTETVVLDPPRAGIEPQALEALAALKPQRLVYISCHPATLARDLKMLSAHAYELISVQPVDMFPHTSHIECITKLQDR